MNKSLGCLLSILWFANAGCATKVIMFKAADGKAKVSLVNFNQLDEEGNVLGETPLKIELSKIQGKVVKLTQPGKMPYFWVVVDAIGEANEATVAFKDNGSGDKALAGDKGGPDRKLVNNRVLRLLLRSYQALSGKHFQVASELAEQAAGIDPELAAPHVIKGISLLQQGDKERAKASLVKAKALDPEDRDIDALLKVSE